jgi:hypothetical protein
MASQPIQQGAPSGASNVVRLPTAAPRKVNNLRFKEQRRIAYDASNRKRFSYRHHTTRKADLDAQTLTELSMTPALLIVAAMFKHLPAEAQCEVMAMVQGHSDTKPEATAKADLVMRLQRMSFREQWELQNAVDRLHGDYSRGEGR